jgi:hypothetical protein
MANVKQTKLRIGHLPRGLICDRPGEVTRYYRRIRAEAREATEAPSNHVARADRHELARPRSRRRPSQAHRHRGWFSTSRSGTRETSRLVRPPRLATNYSRKRQARDPPTICPTPRHDQQHHRSQAGAPLFSREGGEVFIVRAGPRYELISNQDGRAGVGAACPSPTTSLYPRGTALGRREIVHRWYQPQFASRVVSPKTAYLPRTRDLTPSSISS